MSRRLIVQWTIKPLSTPQPWRNCSQCRTQRPFRCSGKFRLNANGRRLDAWLIYRCVACEGTWNRTIFERRPAGDIDPAMMAALQDNNAALAERIACDVATLRMDSRRIDQAADFGVSRLVVGDEPACVPALEIGVLAPHPVPVRLDRLLAGELGLSRSALARFAQSGQLAPTDGLRKSVRDGMILRVEPAEGDMLRRVAARAAGGDTGPPPA
ncbi:MAG: DUF1062 domain-containing protein [Phreatobacter sp.]|uniref:DUF1062 domain-containing protein n=1 Tax=Phreatobacter sp. TaxID=1966341 RepID=UPI001A380225|nr:DUF1062 domain-containing protein [Phreatobacter sp.]MBL8571414.1 DUF1062 domain-containing protein [Phreatobacter sp.]